MLKGRVSARKQLPDAMLGGGAGPAPHGSPHGGHGGHGGHDGHGGHGGHGGKGHEGKHESEKGQQWDEKAERLRLEERQDEGRLRVMSRHAGVVVVYVTWAIMSWFIFTCARAAPPAARCRSCGIRLRNRSGGSAGTGS